MPVPTVAPTPSATNNLEGRLTLALVDDRTANTTTSGTQSTLVVMSRLSAQDYSAATRVAEKIEIGTDGYTGGVAALGQFKGKLTREAVSTKLLGLITGKKQNATPSSTTSWTYRDLANAKFDYMRLVADSTGFVFGSYVAQDAVLDAYDFSVKTGGDAEESYGVMGSHLTKMRAYPIGKAYVVLTADVSGGTVPIGTTFGTNEVPVAISAPSTGEPPNSLYSSGRRNFLKVSLVLSSNRVINGKSYPSGAIVRIREVASAATSGYVSYNSSTKVFTFGDILVAGDVIRVLFASYGADSTPTQILQVSRDTTDEVGIPARMCPVTIASYAFARLDDYNVKVSIPRKEVQGVGEDEVIFGVPGIHQTSYSLSALKQDFDIDAILQTGVPTTGGLNDIYDADYTTRYMLKHALALQVNVKNPSDNGTVLFSIAADHPVFEADDLSGGPGAELSQKYSGKDLGKSVTISATTPA